LQVVVPVVPHFILFYVFVGNALCGVPNGPHKGWSAVPYANWKLEWAVVNFVVIGGIA